MPLVSVVIPTFNRRERVAEAVASVLAQTWRDLELVVVDDGSEDETQGHLASAFADERLRVLRQEQLGVSTARNRGAAATTGEWLAFLDSDDRWLPPKLDRQLFELASRPEHAACYTEEIWYRRGRWANPRRAHAKHSGWIFPQCLALCIISPSSVLIRRQAFEELGGFDESLPACEDYDLWLRLSVRHPILLVPERLIIKHNGHEGQLSQAFWGLDRFRLRALWKLGLDDSVPVSARVAALEVLAAKAGIVAQGAEKRGRPERAGVFRHSREEALRWLKQLESG